MYSILNSVDDIDSGWLLYNSQIRKARTISSQLCSCIYANKKLRFMSWSCLSGSLPRRLDKDLDYVLYTLCL